MRKFILNAVPTLSDIIQCATLAGILVFSSQCVLAQTPPKKNETEKIKIGEAFYTRGQIIADFLDIAFSSEMWNEDLEARRTGGYAKSIDWYKSHNWDIKNPEVKDRYEAQKAWNPWFADYMYRPHGWPRHNVLNKWRDEVSIGVGWPPYTFEGKSRQFKGSPYNSEKIDMFSLMIKEHLEDIIPELQPSIGLPIKILGLADDQDYTNSYAKIRIIPMENLGSRSWTDLTGHNWHPSAYESWLLGGVLFESSSFSLMDAFILPNEENEIGLVICKIKSSLPTDIFKALVTECVVRATGLPGLSKLNQDSYLGNWQHILENQSKPKHNFPSLSAYDKFIINILYCSLLKPSMDKNAVLDILTRNDDCFNFQ